MSHELELILNVAVAVAIALVGGLVAHRLRQPVIVGYLLAGIAIGPFTPGFVGDREQIAALAEVGVIFLMFALGIEFSLKELARVKGVALGGTALQIALTMAVGVGLGAALGWPFTQGLFFGGVIAIASTMVILKTLMDRGEVASAHGRVLLGMGVPLVVVEEDLHLVQELVAAGVPAIYGDASYASVLEAAHPERARLIIVALPDAGTTRAVVRDARRANPAAPILARAARQEEDDALRRAGATMVIAPERAGALLLMEESARVLDVAIVPPADGRAPAVAHRTISPGQDGADAAGPAGA